MRSRRGRTLPTGDTVHHLSLIAAAIAAVVAGLLTSAPPAGAGYLSGVQIKRLFPGRFEAVWKDKFGALVTASAAGTLTGRNRLRTDTGVWKVRGDKLCVSFRVWTADKFKCSRLLADGGWYLGFIRKNGVPRLRFRRR